MTHDERMALSDRELLIRIDTKLEGVIADKKDHEDRIRRLEEARIVMEGQITKAVTPKMLWVGAASAVAAASGAIPLVSWLVNK